MDDRKPWPAMLGIRQTRVNESVPGSALTQDKPPARTLCLNRTMFARKVRVEYEQAGQLQPCPLKWLDSFSMRNFTNATVFDDTLPLVLGFSTGTVSP